MGSETKISWCDSTFNPWMGCSRVSPGCVNCYAAKSTPVRVFGVEWGAGARRARTGRANWKQPLRWNREAEKAGVRRRVFSGSLCDVFDVEAPVGALEDLLRLIDATPALDWLLLTKRAGRLADVRADHGAWSPNVWLGVTVENQEQADKRIPLLLEQAATVRFLSIEPQLEGVTLGLLSEHGRRLIGAQPGISWVIVGGESGPKARPFDLAWARSLRDQCKAAGVPFFMKQLGANAMGDGRHPGRWPLEFLRHRSGADPSEWPEDLRVREFPGHSKEEG